MGWISYMKDKGHHKIRKTIRERKRDCDFGFNLWVSSLVFLKCFSWGVRGCSL